MKASTAVWLGSKLRYRTGVMAFAASLAPPAYSQDFPPVPTVSRNDALKIVKTPLVHMLDGSTCEWIEGTTWFDARKREVLTSGVPVYLFRSTARDVPFLKGVSRGDAVFVARFPAKPGEVIYSEIYVIDKKSGKELLVSRPIRGICNDTKVQVGDVQSMNNDD